jgi:hypothetical protein
MSTSDNVGSDGQSFRGYVGIAEESSFNEGTAPEAYADAVSEGFSSDNQPQELSTIRGGQRYKVEAGAISDSGDLEIPVSPEGILGYLLKGVLGQAEVTTSDPDSDSTGEVGTHTFTFHESLPSYSVEIARGDVDVVRHVGAAVNELSLEHTSEERLTATPSFTASYPDDDQTKATPTYDAHRTLQWFDGTINIAGSDRSPDIQDFSVTLANGEEHQIRGERTAEKAFTGRREHSISATLDFEDTELWKQFLGATGANTPEDELADVAVNAKWASTETIEDTDMNYSLEVDAPKCKISTHEAQLNEQDQIAESVEFMPVVDPSAGHDVKVTLVNGITTEY